MQITRNRRGPDGPRGPLVRLIGGRTRVVTALVTTFVVASGGIAYAGTTIFGRDQVGQTTDRGLVLPSDQTIAPIGQRLLVNNGKLLASSVSPDGKHMAALTTDRSIALTIFDLDGYKIQQQIGTSPDADLKITDGNNGQEGPTYSPDGKTLWMPQINGFDRFPVNADGSVSAPTFISLPVDGTKHPLPAQSVFSADGSTLYATVNGQNKVVAMNPTTGAITQTWNVGNAPRGITLVGNTLYVTNEGGRTATKRDKTINSYGTSIVADPVTGSSTTGTVSVISVKKPSTPVGSIDVGLHPTAVHAAKGAVFVTDTSSDTVSVIDRKRNVVTQTIATQPWPSSEVGYEPDGVTLTNDGHLLVTLGRANALAVYNYTDPQTPVSYVGLLPTDYFPTDVTTVGKQVIVTNLRGIGERGPVQTIDKGPGTSPATGNNTHDSTGTLQRFTLPEDSSTAAATRTVFEQNGWDSSSVTQGGRRNVKAVPVPKRLGDPSKIKHVFLLVKENRSYDQVFGDDSRGNGDPSLAQFGENSTPNQHALARQFGLYDNTYDVGTNSAEGHNWLMQSDNPEYTESTAGEYERSYDTEDDALGHQRSGFLWNGIQAAGKSVRDFGEFTQFLTKPTGSTWSDYYCDAQQMSTSRSGPKVKTYTSSPIPSLNKLVNHAYPKFDTDIPDIYRYEIWKRDFAKNGPSNMNMFWLSSDHTGGDPNPIAQVADNDLAVGKIVDTISHSKYWKSSAIFVIEDDTQNGVDHVDGARGPVQIISPYAQHRTVDSRYYSQITVVRTIEQILGMQPMNQKDSAATPMTKAFVSKPDYTPFTVRPNRVPLTYGVDTTPTCGSDKVAAKYAKLAPAEQGQETVPQSKEKVAAQWKTWSKGQHLTGSRAIPDFANPAQMDHYTWYRAHGWRTAYPGEKQVLSPAQVPGRYLPSPDFDG